MPACKIALGTLIRPWCSRTHLRISLLHRFCKLGTTYLGIYKYAGPMNRNRHASACCGWAVFLAFMFTPKLHALPSFARQTGQKCSACHVGGDWPQLTPWGRFFKLSGYTVGNAIRDNEGSVHVPVGLLGQAGVTWAQTPTNSAGSTVIRHTGDPEPYDFAGEVATKLTSNAGIFYEYFLSNTFPGWKGGTGAVDVRAVHFFHAGSNEILAGVDSNNSPTIQDVWNSTPDWTVPTYRSPEAPGELTAPLISRLGSQAGSIGAYALLNRHFYAEASLYRVGTGFFRWMTAGIPLTQPGITYLSGFNPYWRAFWTTSRGPDSFMLGTFGMRADVFPLASSPRGPTDLLTDSAVDAQYQHLLAKHKVTVRSSYIYEHRDWNASFPLGFVGTQKGNAKFLDLSGSYSLGDRWTFHGGYVLSNANRDSVRYGALSSPRVSGYVLEVDRHLTQNIQLIAQYRGFLSYRGMSSNIDGAGRSATDNNTFWLSAYFAF